MNEQEFNAFVDRLAMQFMEQNPVLATQLGVHKWDDRLADNSLGALESMNDEAKQQLSALSAVDSSDFSKDGQVDYVVVTGVLESIIREHEKLESHLKNPNVYLDEAVGGVFLLLMKDFAPLEDRLRSALGRTREVPRVMEAAWTNLQPERVPPLWVELAHQQAQLGPGLFQGLLLQLSKPFPELQRELAEAGEAAARALSDFRAYLETEVLPVAHGDFAVGTELFNELLAETHMVDYDADELLETGWRLLRETKTEMETVAREIDPGRSVRELLEEAKEHHPFAGELLSTYRETMQATREFVVSRDIVTIPPGETLTIVETPPYLRAIIPYAAYMQPGMFEDDLEGMFLVTPVDLQADPVQQEEKLKGHHYAKLPITTLHEGYPGHHLQLVWSATHGTTARKLGVFLSTLFVEGWAFYCEELMEQLGYIDSPIQRLGRLSDQLWRAARIVLDVSLHCKGMGVQEAVDFLVEEAQHEPSNALAEVRRYTMTPTQPQSYLMGKLEILDIVNEYKRRQPGASLRQMHDAILACGSLPPKLMRKQLFE